MPLEDFVRILSEISGGNLYIAALLAGSICLIFTFAGSIPAIGGKKTSDKIIDLGLGFSAGIMIVASFTSLILPGIELSGIYPVIMGFIIGFFLIFIIEKSIPHEHFIKGYEGSSRFRNKIKTAWMLVIAIIIHNLPEGLAVGTTVVYNFKDGILMAIAIGIQDIPEGFAVSLPLVGIGRSVKLALFIGFLSGLAEALMTVIPVALVGISNSMLPYIFGVSAGAMIYVVSHEVIPETHRHGYEDEATIGLLAGFIVMLILDTLL